MASSSTTSFLVVVLALALVMMSAAPLGAEAKKKKKPAEDFATAEKSGEAAETKQIENSFCGVYCQGRKGMDLVVCKESCDIGQRSNLVQYGRVQCKGKCTEQKGITAPAMKICEEQCDKDYVVKAAEVAAACSKTCEKEKDKMKSNNCKNSCTPPPS